MVLNVSGFTRLAAAACLFIGLAMPAGAQEGGQGKAISLQLNKAADSDAGCRLTFVVKNDTQSLLEKTTYELAVFDASKTVLKLFSFDFGRLPQGKTRVVEFALADIKCSGISRILVNTSPACTADGSASTVCLDALKTSSLIKIVFDQ
jgi:hypothetical protein